MSIDFYVFVSYNPCNVYLRLLVDQESAYNSDVPRGTLLLLTESGSMIIKCN